MYKLHLILKYLRKRRIAWVSLIAVTLCTAMVLVVISVMGGWLTMFRTSFRGLSGDIIIRNDSLAGFPHYHEIIEAVEKVPNVEAAVPVIQTFGLININARKTAGVQVFGYPMGQIGKVNEFPRSLWRQYNQWMEWAEGAPILPQDRRRLRETGLSVRAPEELLKVTDRERAKLQEAIPKAKARLEQLQKELGDSAYVDPGPDSPMSASRRENLELKRSEYLDLFTLNRRLPEMVGSGEPPMYYERQMIRRWLGKIVEDPDVLLAGNEPERALMRQKGLEQLQHPSFKLHLPPEHYKRAFSQANRNARPSIVNEAPTWEGMIAGTGVVNIRKNAEGKLTGREEFLYEIPVSLTVIGVSATGNFDVGNKAERNYWIVDTSRTKVWQYDTNTVYVPFHVLQRDLGMDTQSSLDIDQIQQQVVTPSALSAVVPGPGIASALAPMNLAPIVTGMLAQNKPVAVIPGRASEIHVRVNRAMADDVPRLMEIRNEVQRAVYGVLETRERQAQLNRAAPFRVTEFQGPWPVARTWGENQAKFLGAIEKEMVLVTGLFGLISIVAVFLIFCIFYMIVVEKTRDIGIIKSVGATSSGVAGIFLGYGAVIGIVGAGLGLLVAWGIVKNINELHAWLGHAMKVQIWDPEVYAFDTIPNTMDPQNVALILIIAVMASIVGAIIPAVRAAKLNPVEALRWE